MIPHSMRPPNEVTPGSSRCSKRRVSAGVEFKNGAYNLSMGTLSRHQGHSRMLIAKDPPPHPKVEVTVLSASLGLGGPCARFRLGGGLRVC